MKVSRYECTDRCQAISIPPWGVKVWVYRRWRCEGISIPPWGVKVSVYRHHTYLSVYRHNTYRSVYRHDALLSISLISISLKSPLYSVYPNINRGTAARCSNCRKCMTWVLEWNSVLAPPSRKSSFHQVIFPSTWSSLHPPLALSSHLIITSILFQVIFLSTHGSIKLSFDQAIFLSTHGHRCRLSIHSSSLMW